MIKKLRKNKLVVLIIHGMLSTIAVFAISFGIVNSALWLLHFIAAKTIIITSNGKASATILLAIVINIFLRQKRPHDTQ